MKLFNYRKFVIFFLVYGKSCLQKSNCSYSKTKNIILEIVLKNYNKQINLRNAWKNSHVRKI